MSGVSFSFGAPSSSSSSNEDNDHQNDMQQVLDDTPSNLNTNTITGAGLRRNASHLSLAAANIFTPEN